MIKVLDPGLYSTIQDNGRYGYRNIGVPYSGFMDKESATIANKIVGNELNECLLEITLMGPTLLFNNNYTLSITGGDFNPTINDKKIELYKPIDVKLGDILKINQTSNGARCYLAFSGGIASEKYLGSKLPKGYFVSYLGREDKYTETGFLQFFLNRKSRHFFNKWQWYYDTDEIYNLDGQLDCHVFDACLKDFPQLARFNLSPKNAVKNHFNIAFNKYMQHYKGSDKQKRTLVRRKVFI